MAYQYKKKKKPASVDSSSRVVDSSRPPMWQEWITIDEAKALNADVENWRQHPAEQATSLVDLMTELESLTDDGVPGRGWADSLKYNLRLKKMNDGHLRQEEIDKLPRWIDDNGVERVPVTFGNWNEDQHRLLLAARDPIAAMAAADPEAFKTLLLNIDTKSEGIKKLVSTLADDAGISLDDAWGGKKQIDPDDIDDYDPDKETVSVRVNNVLIGDKDIVVTAVEMTLLELDLPHKVEVF